MILDYILYGMRFKVDNEHILRIDRNVIVDYWKADDLSDVKLEVERHMIKNHNLYKNILIEL